jgi:hypothetical protein
MTPHDPLFGLAVLVIALTIAGAVFAFGAWLSDRQPKRQVPSFVDDAHLADYRHWYAEWCKAVEWLQRNPRVPHRPEGLPRVLTSEGPVIPVDFKRRTRRAA